MAYRGMREWIDHLEKEGELLRIPEEINLEPDAGALGRAVCDIEGPGILAENIVGFTDSRMSIGLHASYRRTAMAMGLPKDTSRQAQIDAWIQAYDRYPVKSRMVREAPCKENIVMGDKVNLFQFAIPRINANDASFYLAKTMCITKDPDSDWVNMGMYRMMILDRNKTGVFLNPFQHIGRHYAKYRERGKPMPMAVALGTEPVLPMISGMKIPLEWNEFDYAGAVRGEPEELVLMETADIPVPATAEIILEGEVTLGEQVLEGPFGEAPGAYSGYFRLPVFEVKAVTYRDNPIFDTLYMGRPNAENHYMTILSKLAGVQQDLRRLFPNITAISFLGPYLFNCVIQAKWRHSGEPRQVMSAWWGSGFGFNSKVVICVDEDVDPWNAFDVLWAITTRSQANRDFVMIPDTETYLDPSQSVAGSSCKLGIDATKPRPPNYRYLPVEWVTPPKGTEEWKKRIESRWQKKEERK